MIKKLIAQEFEVKPEDLEPGRRMEPGEKYTFLVDPDTGKFYRPRDGWEVWATNDTDLADLFIEV